MPMLIEIREVDTSSYFEVVAIFISRHMKPYSCTDSMLGAALTRDEMAGRLEVS